MNLERHNKLDTDSMHTGHISFPHMHIGYQ